MIRCSHFLLAGVLLLTHTSSAPAQQADTRPAIDIVICLDVSNSMEGLLDSAKIALWELVNELAVATPTPMLRIGLYSYGHTSYERAAGWVRKELDLTTDLDAVSAKLNALQTRGGEQYVGRVCRDALHDQKWSTEKNSLRVIFVCGNESASQDPLVKLKDVAEQAKRQSVAINPIFCGSATHRDARDWIELAELAGGKFVAIDQKRGAIAIAAPQDRELADLSARLNGTYVPYGKEGKDRAATQRAQDANASAARARAKAGSLYRNEAWDLVDRWQREPGFDVKKMPADELPAELKVRSPEERENVMRGKLAERVQLQKQIVELSGKREDFLRAERKKKAPDGIIALDEALVGVIRLQAAAKGIRVP